MAWGVSMVGIVFIEVSRPAGNIVDPTVDESKGKIHNDKEASCSPTAQAKATMALARHPM